MIFYTEEQNSQEWFLKKHGVSSSSRVKSILIDKVVGKTELVDVLMTEFSEELAKDDNTYYNHGLEEKDREKIIKKLLTKKKKEFTALSQFDLENLVPRDVIEENWYRAQKKEYFRLLAEKLGYFDDLEEDPRDRGHRLEDEAVEKSEEILDIVTVKAGFIVRDDYKDIGLSPDRVVLSTGAVFELSDEDILASISDGKIEGGLEIKSPGVVNHLQIIFTNLVPSEYWYQVIQYFVVGEVDYVYFVSYNPLVIERPIHIIRIDREDVLDDINFSLYRQIEVMDHLKKDVEELTF